MEPAAVLSSNLIQPISKMVPGQLSSPSKGVSPPHSQPASAFLHVCCFPPLPHVSMETRRVVSCQHVSTGLNCSSCTESYLREKVPLAGSSFSIEVSLFTLCGLQFVFQILPGSRGHPHSSSLSSSCC